MITILTLQNTLPTFLNELSKVRDQDKEKIFNIVHSELTRVASGNFDKDLTKVLDYLTDLNFISFLDSNKPLKLAIISLITEFSSKVFRLTKFPVVIDSIDNIAIYLR